MTAAEGVGAGQGDDFPVVETHAVEDGAEVRLVFGAVGEAAVGRAHGDVAVGAAGAPGDDGALHFLDGADAGEGPEVRVAYPGEFLWGLVRRVFLEREGRLRGVLGTFDWFEKVSGCFQPGVGSVVTFGGEAHRGAV